MAKEDEKSIFHNKVFTVNSDGKVKNIVTPIFGIALEIEL